MLADESGNEGALRNDLAALGPQEIKRAPGQCRAEAAALERRRHLGMHQGDDAWRSMVSNERGAAVELELIAAARWIVPDGV